MMRKILVLATFVLLLSFSMASAQDDLDIDTGWQPFEHGVMIWLRDYDAIIVLQGSSGNSLAGNFFFVQDTWQSGDSNPGATAPDGKFTPERGFGKVWQTFGGSLGSLGWALAPELGYDSSELPDTIQGEINFDGPGDTVYGLTFTSTSPLGGSWRTIDIG
jgi:hypothetical protein